MNLTSFMKAIFDYFTVELVSKTVDDLEIEIADNFLIYFGRFKNGDFYTLEEGLLSILSVKELSEELSLPEVDVKRCLDYLKVISLSTEVAYKGIYVQPKNHWAVGGIHSILKDLITGKITLFSFPVIVFFQPSINLYYEVSITLNRLEGDGLYMIARPVDIHEIEEDKEQEENKPKYTGYYASKDGSMDAHVVIDLFDLNFNLGNVLKYIIRAGKKDPNKHIEDLQKAKKYIDFEIEKVKNS